ncbi:hypothetical protein N7447_007940 [Penicillium robsamsonii]|uniref:uncharacterized protein n=1 Tax=Penicillium robsamsonii TaxID=1792511 RepID=UPI002547256E|nr:uncharacterized protein N7447_007940 [Penicillium robsamsonii]KAJ5817932.1 hypothetical protein N7447_007940 [Penicillium robsamsonii]
MAVSVTHSASDLLLEPLPNLDIPTRRTVSHALHRIKFIGALGQWTHFKTEVANTYNSQTWNPREIASRLTANFLAGSVHEEQVFVSDERGVQGRLEGRAGIALGAVFGAQNHDIKLGASKGALPPYPGYKKAPDFVLMTSAHEAKVVGEVKVPWIREHNLRKLITEFESGAKQDNLRHVLGQIAEYMFDSRLKYGFLTTYEYTIFLRKEEFGRAWGLEYSPVIYHSDRGSTSGRTVSFCQSLYHSGLLALADSNFDTSTGMRNQKWTAPL